MALVVVATFISSLYGEAARNNFERLLTAHLFSLVGAVSVSGEGTLQGHPELGDLRYSSPLSGWYWSVDPVTPNLTGKLESPSLVGRIVPEMPVSQAPFDSSFMRSYTLPGLDNEELSIVETEVVLDNSNRVARFRVMGNLSEVLNEIANFRARLLVYLGVFGIGSIFINAAVILFGLRPLDKVRQALADIREGRSSRLDATLPLEIAPLAREMNALIENNRRIMERSRTQVGNLAHSLKTPLSVLVNEARAMGGAPGRIVQEQSEAMQVQIQHYLQRARIAVQRDSVVFRTPVTPVLERLHRVTAKLHPTFNISFRNDLPVPSLQANGKIWRKSSAIFSKMPVNGGANASLSALRQSPASKGNLKSSLRTMGRGLRQTRLKQPLNAAAASMKQSPERVWGSPLFRIRCANMAAVCILARMRLADWLSGSCCR
ncbi:sensor histidine kinase [Brucella ceti TE28753-12]|nr:sensor histidine kinase [Brucella ceti TE28753-12]